MSTASTTFPADLVTQIDTAADAGTAPVGVAATELPDFAAVEAAADGTPPPADTAVAADELFRRHFIEFTFRTHTYGGRRKLEGVEVTWKGRPIDEKLVSSAQAKLIPDEYQGPVEQARRKLWDLIKTHCLPGDGDGRYYVALDRNEAFIARFREHTAAFEAAADAVAANFAAIRAENRERWRAQIADDEEYQALVGRLLPADAVTLRAAYSIDYRPTEGSQSAAGRRFGSADVQAWFAAAHQNAIAAEDEARRARFAEPINRIRTALEEFQAQLARGTKVTAKSFHGIENALVLFRTCADIMAPSLVATIDGLGAKVEELKRDGAAAMAGRGTFTSVVMRQKKSLDDLVGRLVADCQAATDQAAMAERFGALPRGLRMHR